jgi:hypothetical protein
MAKRASNRLHYNRLQEQCIEYTGSLADYVTQARNTALPDNDLVVLKHMTHFCSAIEQLMADHLKDDSQDVTTMMGEMNLDTHDVYAQMRRDRQYNMEGEPSTIHDDDDEADEEHNTNEDTALIPSHILTVSWLWHADMATRTDPMTGHFAHAFMLSWTSMCQIFYVNCHISPEKRSQAKWWRAQDYVFFDRVKQKHRIEITSDPIRLYSISDLWVAMDLIVCKGLYTEPYSTEMKDYVYALFYRYCELFTVELDDIELVLDNPLFYDVKRTEEENELDALVAELNPVPQQEVGGHDGDDGDDDEENKFEAYKSTVIPVSENMYLRSEYVFDGQILFFSQLYRIHLSDRLVQLEKVHPLRLKHALNEQRVKQSMTAWFRMLIAVTRHPDLSQFVCTDFKNTLMKLHLMHGETEQYKRRWPNAKAVANEVLEQMRASMSTLFEVHKQPPAILAEEHQKSAKYGLECMYLTRQCQSRWMASVKVRKHETITQRFMMEQLVPLAEVNTAIQRSTHELPLFLVLLQRYYVVWGERVFSSSDFVTSYLVWLCLLVERGAFIAKKVHHTLVNELIHYVVY